MNTIQSPDMGSTPINSEEYGYVYCITSLSYTDRCKVGCVWKEGRTPTDRLKEANASTWCMPDFKLEFAKKVKNPREKEGQLHKLLEKYSSRILKNACSKKCTHTNCTKFFESSPSRTIYSTA